MAALDEGIARRNKQRVERFAASAPAITNASKVLTRPSVVSASEKLRTQILRVPNRREAYRCPSAGIKDRRASSEGGHQRARRRRCVLNELKRTTLLAEHPRPNA